MSGDDIAEVLDYSREADDSWGYINEFLLDTLVRRDYVNYRCSLCPNNE